jgi:hypothetical protein
MSQPLKPRLQCNTLASLGFCRKGNNNFAYFNII